jgi:hypothetical protein
MRPAMRSRSGVGALPGRYHQQRCGRPGRACNSRFLELPALGQLRRAINTVTRSNISSVWPEQSGYRVTLCFLHRLGAQCLPLLNSKGHMPLTDISLAKEIPFRT